MRKKIVLLASDTIHRRYFIKKIAASGIPIDLIVFETDSIQPPFPIGPFFKEEEEKFEKENFFREFDDDLSNLNVEKVKTINDAKAIELINNIEPDFGVVFGTRKVAKKVTSLFKDGLINVHRGMAQEYRGLDTNLWAIYHNDISNVGVTVHLVNNELDTGNIVFEESASLPGKVNVFELRYYETVLATDMTIRAIQSYLNGELKSYPQEKIGRYYSFMPLVIKETLPAKLAKILESNYAK